MTVFELLAENGLSDFYKLGDVVGVRVKPGSQEGQFRYLDEPSVRERLVDFADQKLTKVTFHVPTIHCIACVWLLENLFRLETGIGRSEVNFPKKEVSISFETARLKLSELVTLLASLGYEPELKFSELENKQPNKNARRLWIQLGIAGFAFGNIMLLSISSYLGLDSFNGPGFKSLFGYISLVLAVPVFFYSAADYWRAAWLSLHKRLLTIDVPIAAGILALFAESSYEVVFGRGEGYFDSLAGLLFFLLCGKLFQQKTFDRLAFDRDYKAFFPLAVTRLQPGNTNEPIEEQVSLSQLSVGDRLLIRNGELIPADARLVDGPAMIDYSFVTGESQPVQKLADDYLYAGGRQIGGVIEVETLKPVSQSYLTSLWNQDAFRKAKGESLDTLTNRYSQRFAKLLLGIAVGAALFWAVRDPGRAVKSFTSVLIVACPCALALAAPFALGTAQRVLGRRNVFLKNPSILETLARVDAVIFDKTGTLTANGAGAVRFQGPGLTIDEERWVYAMTRHSTHPNSVRLGYAIGGAHEADTVRSFRETAGCGMEGSVANHEIWVGSAAWLASRNAYTFSDTSFRTLSGFAQNPSTPASTVHIAIDGQYRGFYVLETALRPEVDQLIGKLSDKYELALLSGDNQKEVDRFRKLFHSSSHLRFNQSPLHKLEFIRKFQEGGKTVMMVGDGLNDSGALKQSDVGVAVVENISAFSPASDIIMTAGMVPRLHQVLHFSKMAVRVVRLSFLISSLYNIVGISIAARGLLSPVICAVLMPLSSVTVVVFACGLTTWFSRRAGLVQVFQTAFPVSASRSEGEKPQEAEATKLELTSVVSNA